MCDILINGGAYMRERRRANRKTVDILVSKLVNGNSYSCRACEISPSGIRLKWILSPESGDRIINIELSLVEGKLTTVLSARKIWRSKGYEAFEFVDPSFAQRTILHQLYGTYGKYAEG
jgi:hypothetical protein